MPEKFEPYKITKQHVEQAIARIEREGITLISSTGYDVIINGKAYPPKEIMRYAHEEMNGQHLWNYPGGEQTNKFLRAMKFRIIDKNQTGNKFDDLINRYIARVSDTGNTGEIYKWRLLKSQKGKPDVTAADFAKSVEETEFSNLIYPIGVGVTKYIANNLTDQFKDAFIMLCDEQQDLNYRVREFNQRTLALYRKLDKEEKHTHHQDERTIATYLTYHNPDKYTFYKDTFYQKYCKFLGILPKKPLEKYSHYMSLIDDFIKNHVSGNKELMRLKNQFLDKDCYDDPNNKILAQDILYQMFDLGKEQIDIGQHKVYKISMGDFSLEEVNSFIKEGLVLVHGDTKPKGQSYERQGELFRNVINEGDYFYLTHGNRGIKLLGRFTGNATIAENSDYGDDGWLQRKFDVVLYSINQSAYKGKSKWWTPNNISTCIRVKDSELDEANKLIFTPYFNAELTKSKIDSEEPSSTESNTNIMKEALNQILYGPPGTGKTFNAITKAVAIASPSFNLRAPRKDLKTEFDRLVKDGRIALTTFHQSLSYEDFIEGIKPNLDEQQTEEVSYAVKDGIFKAMCKKAAEKKTVKNNFQQAYDSLLNEIRSKKESGLVLETTVQSREFTVYENSKGNLRFHANTEKKYEGVMKKDVIEHYLKTGEALDWAPYTKAVAKYIEEKHKYSQTQEALKENYVLIIDEINRGNVSSIFGELITLVEEDKRADGKEALEVTLPYSKRPFAVPNNLFLVGTMNTADRSVEALDTALRRRFSFYEYAPDTKFVRSELINWYRDKFIEMWSIDWNDKNWIAFETEFKQLLLSTEVYDAKKAELETMVNKDKEDNSDFQQFFDNQGIKFLPEVIMATINRRVEKLLDKDHMMGHSYFMSVKSVQDLKRTIKDKVIPLLQEYFFGDYGKMGLVLGSDFFDAKEAKNEEPVFADFDYTEKSSLENRDIYRLKDLDEMTDEDFLNAARNLLKSK